MNMSIDFENAGSISKYQSKLAKSIIQYTTIHSPYYKALLQRERIDADNISSLEDFKNIPITTKTDLLRYNSQFFCCPDERADTVMTSGSTGSFPIIHPLAKTDLRRLAYNEKVSFLTAGVKKEDTVMLCTALDGSFVAGLAYYLGLKEIGANILRVGAKNLKMQMDALSATAINTIVGVPSNLITLYNYFEKSGMIQGLDDVTKLILIGESIRKEDFSLNQRGQRLATCFPKAILHSTYANTETCSSFCECQHGNGGHLHPQMAYAEVVDESGHSVPEGALGHLIITTFGSRGMPLIRYDTGDITFKISEPCPCGRSSIRIGPIIDRINSIIKIRGVTCSQSQLEEVLLSENGIDDYCIEITNTVSHGESVCIWISGEKNIEFLKNKVKAEIWENVRINAVVKHCSKEALKELQFSTGSRKPVRFMKTERLD